MEVTLRIPKNRVLHTWWTNCTDEERSDALDLAASWMVVQKHKTPPQDGCSLNTLNTRSGIEMARQETVCTRDLKNILSETVACEIRNADVEDEYIIEIQDKCMLICVKELDNLRTNPHVEEFRKHVYAKGCAKEIHAAVLFSLRCRLPNVSSACQISYMKIANSQKIPLLMISTQSRSSIQIALQSAIQLMSSQTLLSSSEEELKKETDALRRFLNPFLVQLRVRETGIQARIEMLQMMLDDALAERQQHRDNMYNLHRLGENVSWVSNEERDDEATMNHATEILSQYLKHDETPKTSKMSQVQRQVIRNAGGIKAVTEALRRKAAESELGQPRV